MEFIKGLVLNEKYYRDVVAHILHQFDAGLTYSCSLLGYGSDVLGFDTARSMDHNWGPRLQIFLDEADVPRKPELDAYLSAHLPPRFMGLPTHFASNPGDPIQRLAPTVGPPIKHLIEIYGIDAFIQSICGKPSANLSLLDWLTIPEQVLLEATSGKVFHDGLDKLTPFRNHLRYYPLDVQKLKLAALWNSIADEEAFLGRSIENDDFAGTKLIAARLANTLMKICFCLKRQYMPYSKWFTTMFGTLGLKKIESLVSQLLKENNLRLVEQTMASLYCEIVALNNTVNDIPNIQNTVRNYYGRPYKVIMASGIVSQLIESIEDATIQSKHLQTVFIDSKIDGADFTNTRYILSRMVANTGT